MIRSGCWLPFVLCACGSVTIPEETFYRIELPRPELAAFTDLMILRVQNIQLGGALQGDRLMVASEPFHLQPYDLHRWAGPLDQILLDAVLSGLERSRAFTQVKAPWEAGREDLLLNGRVLDFHAVTENGAPFGRVTLDLKITRSADGKALWQKELTRSDPAQSAAPSAIVAALSHAMGQVVGDVLIGCRENGVLATPAK